MSLFTRETWAEAQERVAHDAALAFVQEARDVLGRHNLDRAGLDRVHPHMLRHGCGFKLANDGHDTRAIQHYMGHRNIQHTVRYTELAADRFNGFWKD